MFVTEAVDRIEACLEELAKAQGYSLGPSSRYAPLRGTDFMDQRKRYVGGDRPPQKLMTWPVFADVSKRLVDESKRVLGSARAAEIQTALAAAWERDCKIALTAPGEIPKRWHALKKAHDITLARTDHPSNFYWLLYDLIYAPMLIDDRVTFNANNDAIRAALANRDPAFRQDDEGYYKAWGLYASVAGFCLHRLVDPRHRAHVAFLNRIYAQTRLGVVKAEHLTHAHYLNNLSGLSARAFEITQSDAMAKEWHVLRAYDVGRAAYTCLMQGMELDARPKEFGGKTILHVLQDFENVLQTNNHHVQNAIFKIIRLWPAAGAGDVDKVYLETDQLLREGSVISQGKVLGRSVHVERLTALLRARVHYVASQGQNGFHLVEAHRLVSGIAGYYKRMVGGETNLIRDILAHHAQIEEKHIAA